MVQLDMVALMERRRPKGQAGRILAMLEDAGPKGLTTIQLCHGAYSPNYKARISELRQMGWNVQAERIEGDTTQWRYFL